MNPLTYIRDARSRRRVRPQRGSFQYPKQRPVLTAPYQAVFVEEYKTNRHGTSLATKASQWLEGWMHRQVAADQKSGGNILEIGAGTLNHLRYETSASPETYDIVEPFSDLFSGSEGISKISNVYNSIFEIPVTEKYDRIISIAVLEHLEDLPLEIARAHDLLAPGGLFQAGIPVEGGLLWGLAWRFSTGLSFRLRTGLSYKPFMDHEHLNNYEEISREIRAKFASVSVRFFPLPIKHLAIYAYIKAT